MRENTQKIILVVALMMVILLALWAGYHAQVAPEIVENWDSEEMPVMTAVGPWKLHLPLSIYILSLGVSLTAIVWCCTRKEIKLHVLTCVLVLCGGWMIAVGRWPLELFGWDQDVHHMWAYVFSGWENYSLTEYVAIFNTWFWGYLPYSAGMALGKLLGLAESWALRLGFMTGVVVYAVLCTAAVKVTPRYKLSFMVAAILPTCLVQASCISYDAVVTASILLGLALLIREIDRTGLISPCAAIGMLLSLTLGTLAKPAYSALLLLAWMLPQKKFGSVKRQRAFRLQVVLILGMCAYSCLLGMYADQMAGDERMGDTDSAAQIAFIMANPLFFLREMGEFLVTRTPTDIAWVASDWAHKGANRTSANILLAVLWGLCPLYSQQEQNTGLLTWKKRILMLVVGTLPLIILMITQYIVSTPVGSDSIAGVQPRYVLPLLPIWSMSVMLPQWWRNRMEKHSRWVAIIASLATVVFLYMDGWRFVIEGMQGIVVG